MTCFCRKSVKAKVRAAFFAVGLLSAASSVWAAGLPGEFVLSDRWRHVYSMYSGVTNPAFINEENYMTLRYLIASTMQEFNMHEAGYTMPLGLYDAVGVSWMMQWVNPYAAMDGGGNPTGSNVYDATQFIAFSYARNVWNRLTVGGNLDIIAQNIPPMPSEGIQAGLRFGVGVDVGLTWKLLRHPMLGNHIIGMSTNNIINVIDPAQTEERYSAALRFSLLSDFWERRIYYGADFTTKDIMSADWDWDLTNPKAREADWEFTQKLGFNILRIFKLYLLGGFNPNGFDHYGFAFGANMPGFFNGRDIEGLMQYVSIAEGDGAAHLTFYARTEIGKHREEIYARKMARRGTLGPNNLYNQALELFHKGECFRAFWIFSQIAVEYPDFFKNDMVSYYQAACEECMDMRQSAVSAFRRTKDDHSRSVAVPMADLGLMRIFYRGGDYSAVENQFEELNGLGVPDSIKYHAYYIMGQTAIQRGDYARARQLFTTIPENHPDYVFAYHSAAVANMLNDNIQGAIADLEFVIQIKPQNKAQEEAINRSFVFLGYLYYEDLATEGALARAVTALRRVPKTSYYYQDALLGLGWTALKARQWSDCLSAGSELAKTATDPVLQSEGNLIQAYAYAMQKNYAQAVSLLDATTKVLNSYTPPSESELGQRRAEYNDSRSEYEQMGFKIDELGQARQSSVVQTSIDSLQNPQAKLKSNIDQHLKFEDEYKRGNFFARTLEQVKEDVDYALARFTRYAGSRGVQKQLDKGGKTDAIDDELERLKKELEQAK